MSVARPRLLDGAMRWLLQVDHPVPEKSDAEILVEVERNYRWNFAMNLLDGGAFWFAFSFASATTILPLFVSKLTPNPLAIGLLAVIAQGAWYLPQLFTANATEQLARKKPIVVNLGLFMERIPAWLLVLAALLAIRTPELALIVFLLGYAWQTLGAGAVATAWQDLLARCIPVDRRGRFFGTTTFIGVGAGALGSIVSAWLLETQPFPVNFAYTFAIAAAAMTVSWIFLALVREPVQPVSVPRQTNRQYWAGLPGILRQDDNFRRFLIARMLLALGGMGSGFVALAAVTRWELPDSTAGVFTGVLLVGETIGNLALGWLADRHGHKLPLEVAALALLLSFSLAWLAPSPVFFYAVFALAGFSLGAVIVSGILVVLEFSETGRRPTYIGLANTGVGIVSTGAPLLGAWIIGFGYEWLFAICAAVNLLAFVVMRWWVKEPRWETARLAASKPGVEELFV